MKLIGKKLILFEPSNADRDIRLVNIVCCYYLVSALNLAVELVWGDFNGWSIISKGYLAIMLAVACTAICARKGMKVLFCAESIVSVLFLQTFLLRTYNESFQTIVFNTLAVYIPIGICVFYIKDISVLYNKLYRFSFVTQLVLFYVAIRFQRTSSVGYSMSIGYLLLFQLLIVLLHFFLQKKIVDLIFIGVDVFFILIYGSRGPLLCVAFCGCLYVITETSLNGGKKLIISLLAITIVWNGEYIVNSILSFLPNDLIGSSRTISMYLKGQLTSSDSGRGLIFQEYMQLINTRPLTGFGLAGGWRYSSYPHNIIIELMLAFGIPIGLFLFLCLLYCSIRGLNQKNNEERRLFSIFLSFCISLLYSGSFVMTLEFYILIALMSRRFITRYVNN